MQISTPLEPGTFVVESLTGVEAISELFEFQVDLLASPESKVPFEKLLGRSTVVEIHPKTGQKRYITGIFSRFSQGAKLSGPFGADSYIRYRATVVPRLWLLTRKSCSRIFQQIAIPDIL